MIKEDTCTGDMAQATPKVGSTVEKRKFKKKKKSKIMEDIESGEQKTFRGDPVFDLDSSDEFHSFAKGTKNFRQWRKHTRSEDIRQFANKNYAKDFYVTHQGAYIKVHRGRPMKVESTDALGLLLTEAWLFGTKEEVWDSLKRAAKSIMKYYRQNDPEGTYAYAGAMQHVVLQGNKFIDDDMIAKFKDWTNDTKLAKLADHILSTKG